MRRCSLFALAIVVFAVSSASAHYLWVTIDSSDTANVYFEGGPGPGDGQYLDPFIQRGTAWFRTAEDPTAKKLELEVTEKPGKRWLSAKLAESGDRAVEMYAKWGVYRYGDTDVLLHYYGRCLDVSSNDSLRQLATAPHLDLDIVLTTTDDGVRAQVLWKGNPVGNRPLYLRGAGGNQNLKTDDKGTLDILIEKPGRYTLRTGVEEEESGTDDGLDFQLIRHQCTLVLNLPFTD